MNWKQRVEKFDPKINRANWKKNGSWDLEPDFISWESSGLSCVMIRHDHGAWCGYVGVNKHHPKFSSNYDEIEVDVHGGLTYSDVLPQMHNDLIYFGFDCCHCDDFTPTWPFSYLRIGATSGDSYKDVTYVRNQVASLAKQLKDMI